MSVNDAIKDMLYGHEHRWRVAEHELEQARAEVARLTAEVEAMKAVVEEAHAINERLQEAKDEPYEDGWRTIFKHGGYDLVGRFADALDALRARKVGG